MITNQISDWYASPQTVTVDDMTNFSQDLYQRIAQIGYNKIPCIIDLKGNLIYNSENLTEIILPEGCFIFKETNYNFLTYQTFPIGIAQSTTLDLNSINDGYIVARYSIDPTIPSQTSYKINTSYTITTNINIVTDVLICTIKNGILIENGAFLFEPKQYIINNLTKFYTLNINYANTFPRSSASLTSDNTRFYINDVELINNVPYQKIFSFYDPISGITNENQFGNYLTDSAPINMTFGLVNSVSDTSNNLITIKFLSNAGLVIDALFNYIKYKKINKNFYFMGSDNVNNKGLLIYGNSIYPQYKFYDFCQIIYDVIFYNNKWYLSTDTGIYSGTDIEDVSIINGITIGSYYFKFYNCNGNNILLLINSEYCEFIGNGLTDYYYLSTNGTTFTQYKLPSSSLSGFNDLIANIECNEKVFIAIGQQNVTLGAASVYISYDAINWNSISTITNPNTFTSTAGNNAYKLKYINNKFILLLLTCNVGNSPNFIKLYCSNDGITWFEGNTVRATDLIDRGVANQNIIRRYSLHNDLFYFKGYYIFYGKSCLYSFTLNERG